MKHEEDWTTRINVMPQVRQETFDDKLSMKYFLVE
jgi:hypothetical protein